MAIGIQAMKFLIISRAIDDNQLQIQAFSGLINHFLCDCDVRMSLQNAKKPEKIKNKIFEDREITI